MAIRRVCGLVALAAVMVMAFGSAAHAQLVTPGLTALEAVSGGSLASRSPGHMVIAGVARAQDAVQIRRNFSHITQTSRPSSLRSQVLADSIATVFNQLNLAIVAFQNVLLARAGQPLVIPDNLFSVSTGTPLGQDSGAGLDNLDLGALIDQFGGLAR